jgi:hypothetical protein
MGFNFNTKKLVHSAKVSTQRTSSSGPTKYSMQEKVSRMRENARKVVILEEDAPVLTPITVPNPSTFFYSVHTCSLFFADFLV